ncbi:MAG: Cellulosome-anchoring protein precursor, partial [Chloroflexota bacterium]
MYKHVFGYVVIVITLVVLTVAGSLVQPTTGYAQSAPATIQPTKDGAMIVRPSGPYNLKKVAVGTNFVIAILDNQTLVTWGSNRFWQTTIPFRLKTTLFTDVAAGARVAYALDTTGQVSAWPAPIDCPLCVDGENVVPVAAQSGVTAISANGSNAIALKSDGTVVVWGNNKFGQLNVPPSVTGITAVAAGAAHMLALKSDGTVIAWGRNHLGQLNVPYGMSGVTAIAAGVDHSLALLSTGEVVAWGSNNYGESKAPGLRGVTAIAAGLYFSAALRNDGTVVAWGDNSDGNVSGLRSSVGANVIGAGGVNSVVGYTSGKVRAYGARTFNALVSRTPTPSPYMSPTFTSTRTRTPSNTRTFTRTRTSSNTRTSSRTYTPTDTDTPTET